MDHSRAPRRARHAPANNAGPSRRTGAGVRGGQPRLTPDTHRTPEMPEGGSSAERRVIPPLNFNSRLLRPPRMGGTPRLSVEGLIDDDSGSEPDNSMIATTSAAVEPMRNSRSDESYHSGRGEATRIQLGLTETLRPQQSTYHEATGTSEGQYDEQYEAEDTSQEGPVEDEATEEEVNDDEEVEDNEEAAPPLIDPAAAGLKEISNLGKFTVSSHKQGNGVEELRSDDTSLYWQSDGPQPHKLTVYFVKRVGIRDIRFYVDYGEDESYTPTKIVFKSGTSENNLIEFATVNLENPKGWQQVPIANAGGDPDGHTLVSYVLQMQILENHQNGKDTHLRGIKIYAFDSDSPQGVAAAAAAKGTSTEAMAMAVSKEGRRLSKEGEDGSQPGEGADGMLRMLAKTIANTSLESGAEGLTIPDYMREPELR